VAVVSPFQPTGTITRKPVVEPTFPEYDPYADQPLNAHVTEGDWPDLSDPDEAPLWGMGEPLTTDPYEFRMEARRG
jgi:hypothetical protein